MTTTPELVGGEPWQQALYRRLMSHADDHRELLAGYQKVADESHSGAFRYLASLLVEDELRHQRFMNEMARTLQTEVDCRREERAIPPVGQWGFERDHIVELTERFLALEGNDGRELRKLGSDLQGVKDTTVWQLLVRLMEADTDKHIQILRFVNQHAANRGASQPALDRCQTTPPNGRHPTFRPVPAVARHRQLRHVAAGVAQRRIQDEPVS